LRVELAGTADTVVATEPLPPLWAVLKGLAEVMGDVLTLELTTIRMPDTTPVPPFAN
jgi:hypothetical protein